MHSENPNWNRTFIDSNISLNFEPNKYENKYKRFIILKAKRIELHLVRTFTT